MHDSIVIIFAIIFTFLLAGMVKGVIGMGLPTVAMGLLGIVMAPVQAAALLIVPTLITNVWQLVVGPSVTALLKRFWALLIGLCLGTAIGVTLLTSGPREFASLALGALLVVYGVFGLASPRFSVQPGAEGWLSPIIGVATGILTGATGISVIPLAPYLGSLHLEKEELIQTLGLSFTVATIALGIGLALYGRFEMSIAGNSVLALVPALGGMFLGQLIRDRLKPEAFRRWFFIGLIVIGTYMVVRVLINHYR